MSDEFSDGYTRGRMRGFDEGREVGRDELRVENERLRAALETAQKALENHEELIDWIRALPRMAIVTTANSVNDNARDEISAALNPEVKK